MIRTATDPVFVMITRQTCLRKSYLFFGLGQVQEWGIWNIDLTLEGGKVGGTRTLSY